MMMKERLIIQHRNEWKDCFIGRDAVTLFRARNYVNNRHGGLLLGRQLVQRGYIKYAGTEHRDFEDEIKFFYQFTVRDVNAGNTMNAVNAGNTVNAGNVSSDESEGNMLRAFATMSTPESTSLAVTPANEAADVVAMESSKSTKSTKSMSHSPTNAEGQSSAIPTTSLKFSQTASTLSAIIDSMRHTITRSSHRSNTLCSREDIYSGKEIVDWLIVQKHAKDRVHAVHFGTYLRGKGFIRHIEFQPVFRDSDDEFYKIVNLEEDDSTFAQLDGVGAPNLSSQSSQHSAYSTHRATLAVMTSPVSAGKRRNNGDSISSNMTSASEIIRNTQHNRTSLVLGQMGRGRSTRARRKEQLVQDLFTFIIRSQTKASSDEAKRTADPLPEILLQEDMKVDGPDHPDIKRLLVKIERKFKKCDEHSRGSLGKEEFNRFLIKCGVILHQQDLTVIFKIFDKNQTG